MSNYRERDFQRKKVYDWESNTLGIWNHGNLPDSEIKWLVEAVFNEYGLIPPKVIFSNKRRGACSAKGGRKLVFGKHARQRYVVLHECAHSICYSKLDHAAAFSGKKKHPASHGREWVSTYINLVDRWISEGDALYMKMTAISNGIQID